MFIFFNNRVGCLGSLAISLIATVLLVVLLRACSHGAIVATVARAAPADDLLPLRAFPPPTASGHRLPAFRGPGPRAPRALRPRTDRRSRPLGGIARATLRSRAM